MSAPQLPRFAPVGRETALRIEFQPPPRRSWRRIAGRCAGLLYIAAATLAAVFLAAHAPLPGGPVANWIPSDAQAVVIVPSGARLYEALRDHPAVRELAADAEMQALLESHKGLRSALKRLRADHAKLPGVLRERYPLAPDTLRPVLGGELAFVLLPPDAARGGRAPRALLFTRVSGAEALLLKVALAFRSQFNAVQAYDCGGDLLALGFEGAAPRFTAAQAEPLADSISSPEALALVRWSPATPSPSATEREHAHLPPDYAAAAEELLPPSLQRALVQPPSVWNALFGDVPAGVRAALRRAPGGPPGALELRGTLGSHTGPAPELPPLDEQALRGPSYVAARLPLQVQPAFNLWVERELRASSGPAGTMRLSRSQRFWLQVFESLNELGANPERDLWPAFGNAVELSISQPSAELDSTGYGMVGLRVPFKGSAAARESAGAALTAYFGAVYDGPPPENARLRFPFLRRHRSHERDRYVQATGQIHAPMFDLERERLVLVSNAGPFALHQPEAAEMPPIPFAAPADERFFLALDGPRLAPTVEKVSTALLEDEEKELGAEAFLDAHPDAQADVSRRVKLVRLAGTLAVSATAPGSSRAGALRVDWIPGTLAQSAAPVQRALPLPPPPPPPPAP